ncbi:4-amino-4-deoxychorismate lyase [Mariprofundus micogutta]|uniref:4-amino-4-deoxychorismate lyase n=1 Tax=Mariprofundus micogutta TaxID=1921010 RepID=A0A1L8CN89_9PROT|nr:aminotransferase class IV [Mariprofundus micogutta]GAV20386.1 4-amino-4-deoxychorismate lyase [Mariprofundus micogutta]
MKITKVENLERGLAYGEACFETFRVINGQIFDWPGHWQRLASGLSEFGLDVPAGQDQEVLCACLREAARTGPDVLLRLTISGGEASWGLTAKAGEAAVYIQCMPYTGNHAPGALRLQSWPFPLRKKQSKFTSDYAETLRALRGVNDSHVLFEQDGMLISTATANILLYRDGHWSTPNADAGVLPGRVRDFLIRNALLVEEPCPVAWLEDCEAAAICNSGLFIQPLACIVDVARQDAMDIHHTALQPLIDILQQQEGVQLL